MTKQVKKIQNQTTTENGLFVINNEKNNLEIAVKHKEIEIAKNFIALDLDSATIAKGTGLTVENIEQLRNETKKNWWQHWFGENQGRSANLNFRNFNKLLCLVKFGAF